MAIIFKSALLFILLIFVEVQSSIIRDQEVKSEIEFENMHKVAELNNQCKAVGIFKMDCNLCFCASIGKTSVCSNETCSNLVEPDSIQIALTKSEIIKYMGFLGLESSSSEKEEFLDESGKCLKSGNFIDKCNKCICVTGFFRACTLALCPEIN
jgi:hypothetical protein